MFCTMLATNHPIILGALAVAAVALLAMLGVATTVTATGGGGRRGPITYSASAAPTADNDSLHGHMKGDVIVTSLGTYQCRDASAAAAVWDLAAGGPVASGTGERVIRETPLGGGSVLRRAYIEEAKTFAGGGSANLTTQIPANSRVLSASLNYDTAVVLSTAVKVGLGTSGTPNLLALSGTAVTKNTKTDAQPLEANSLFAAATTLQIAACATGGTAAGTVTSGTVRARVIYEYITSIVDAA